MDNFTRIKRYCRKLELHRLHNEITLHSPFENHEFSIDLFP